MRLKQLFNRGLAVALLVGLPLSGNLSAQSNGDNLDFSYGLTIPDGGYTNWEGEYGTWSSSGLNEDVMNDGFTNTTSDPNTGFPIGGTPQIMTGGYDTYISTLSTVPPYVSGVNSSKLGDDDHSLGEVNRLKYNLTVSENNSFFYYDYAVVFLDPSDDDPDTPPHFDNERPLFSVRITNASGTVNGACGDYEVISGVDNAYNGFNEQDYTFDETTGTLLWKDWTRVGMDLTDYIGQNITIVFESRDCALGGHFGYAYISAGVFDPVLELDACEGASTIELPLGFETYSWSTDPTETSNIETIGFGTTSDVTCDIVSENGCTLEVVIDVENDFSGAQEVSNVYCTNTLELDNCLANDPNATFLWSPAINLSSTTDAIVTVQATADLYNASQNYTLQTTLGTEVYESYYTVNFNGDLFTAGDDVTLNCGQSAELGPCGPLDGANYLWTPSTGLFNSSGGSGATIANPIVKEVIGNYPSQVYTLTITHDGNTYVDQVIVNFTESIFNAGDDVSLACSESIQIGPCATIPGATYSWSPNYNMNNPSLVNPTVYIGETSNVETTYELTITLDDGTEVTDDVVLFLDGNPADLGPNITDECGPIDLDVCTVINGATYQWSPPEGLSTTTGPSTTVTPYIEGVYPEAYTLTITDGADVYTDVIQIDYDGGAQTTFDLDIVEVIGEEVILDDFINNCEDRLPQLFKAVGGPADMTYSWEILSSSANPEIDIYEFMETDFIGAPANNSEVSIQFHDFSDPFIFLKVTGISPSSPCFVGEGYIKVRYCCTEPERLYMYDNFAISGLVDSTSVYSSIYVGASGEINVTGQNMIIADTLIIDTDTDWNQCDVIFKENAAVILEPGVSLSIRFSELYACHKMWDGIYVNHPNSSLTFSQQNIVRDAHQAVVSDNGGQIYISQVDFIDNNKGVVVKNFAIGATTPAVHPSNINTSNFMTQQMHYPLEGEIPYAGIEIENVEKYHPGSAPDVDIFGLGTPLQILPFYIDGTGAAIDVNRFVGLQNGIRMVNTQESVIAKHEFRDCIIGISVNNSRNDLFYRNAFLGTGIINEGMRMKNIKGAETYLNYFRDCEGGIVATNGALYNLYDEPHLTSGTTEMNYMNYFDGKGLAHRTSHLRVRAEGNQIFESGSHFANVKRGTKILNNNIQEIADGTTAIRVTNYSLTPLGTDVDVVDNTITIDHHGIGIWMSSLNSFNDADLAVDSESSNHQVAVVDNSIRMNNMDNNISYGIRIENCSNIIAGFNSVENVNNLNLPAQFFTLRGLSLAQSQDAQIISNTFTKMSLGLRGIGDLLGSIYECNVFDENYHGVYFEGSTTTPTAFTYVSQQGGPSLGQGPPETHNNEWYDAVYSNDRIGGSADNFPAVTWHWKLENPLLYQHNSVLGIDPVIEGNSLVACGLSAPAEWTEEVDYSLLMAIATESNEYLVMQDQAQFYDNSFAYRVLRENPGIRNPDTADGLVLYNFYELLDNSNFREFYDITAHISSGDLELALTRNADVLSDLLIEQNQKQVNSIYINQLINESEVLTDAERELLESVAYLTPYLGGDAVYTARAMLGIDPDDYGIAYRQAAPETDDLNSIVMHPNPSTGNLILTFDTPNDKICIFECYDLQGKRLKTYSLVAYETTHEIDLNAVAAGMYLVRVLQGNEVLLNEKLILTK